MSERAPEHKTSFEPHTLVPHAILMVHIPYGEYVKLINEIEFLKKEIIRLQTETNDMLKARISAVEKERYDDLHKLGVFEKDEVTR